VAACASLFGWGGDGTVQRCVDPVAGIGAVVAILSVGTANLLATNLHVPDDRRPGHPHDPVHILPQRSI
jgi:diacylglycerol kinase family enzyme